MGKFSIKSVIMGIGIGFVLSAGINIFCTIGSDKLESVSDEDIIMRARQLGMVKSTELIKKERDVLEENEKSD